MFTIRWVRSAQEKYDELKKVAEKSQQARKQKGMKKSSQAEGLFKQVTKTINFLRKNPKHPSLRTHQYSSIENPFDKKDKVFEAYAQNQTPGAYRVFWCYGPKKKEITIIAITPHP